jgi:hypothetical protein
MQIDDENNSEKNKKPVPFQINNFNLRAPIGVGNEQRLFWESVRRKIQHVKGLKKYLGMLNTMFRTIC